MSMIMLGTIIVLALTVCICMGIRTDAINKNAKIIADASNTDTENQKRIAKYEYDKVVDAEKVRADSEAALLKSKQDHERKMQQERIAAELHLETLRLDPDYFKKQEQEQERIRAEEEAEKQLAEANKRVSPYYLKRSRHSTKSNWGYCIYHKKTDKPLSSDGYWQFFDDISRAIEVLNEIETVEGYDKTKVL